MWVATILNTVVLEAEVAAGMVTITNCCCFCRHWFLHRFEKSRQKRYRTDYGLLCSYLFWQEKKELEKKLLIGICCICTFRSDNTLSNFFSHQILGSEEVEGEEQLAPENSAFDGFGLAGKKISRARILLSLLFTATTDIFECFSTNGLQFVYKDFATV